MTRLPTNQNRFHRPASVSIGELAIAAGMAGYSLGVCYRDYSAPVLCELWRHYASSLAANEVHHVRTPAEARKLGDKVRSSCPFSWSNPPRLTCQGQTSRESGIVK